MISYQPVSHIEFETFTAAFNRAYSDYYVPIAMTVPSFRSLIVRDDLDLEASVVALDGDEPVGMGLLGIRGDQGWIGGMGVVPKRRRQGIGRQMMHYLLDRARERQIRQVKLEVIEANTGAHNLYLQLGFEHVRYLLVLERLPAPVDDSALPYRIEERSAVEGLRHYEGFHDFPNCWQRDLPSLYALVPYFKGWAALQDDEIAAYAVGWADPHTIRLIDIASRPAPHRHAAGQAILTHLHRQHPQADGNSYNIAEDDPVRPAFEALGYTVAFRQIELRRLLTDHL